MVKCPAHDDGKASLSITENPDGTFNFKCFTGKCQWQDIVRGAGFDPSTFWTKSNGTDGKSKRKTKPAPAPAPAPAPTHGTNAKSENKPHTLGKIVAIYPYHDREGNHVYDVVRYDPKDFRQRRLVKNDDGTSTYAWGLNAGEYYQAKGRSKDWYPVSRKTPEDAARRTLPEQERFPYGLPAVMSCDSIVYLVEGEKDVQALRKLGCIASTVPGGAGKWRPEYAEYFEGKHIVVIPDNDDAGRIGADAIASHLVAKSKVRVLDIGINNDGIVIPVKGDISDWIDGGGNYDRLVKITDTLKPYRRPAGKKEERKIQFGAYEFTVNERGLFADYDGERIMVSSPLYVDALTRSVNNDEWGRLLTFPDPDGHEHSWVMPSSFLSGDGMPYREALLSMGLEIRPGIEPKRALDAYLRAPIKEKARCVEKVGWYERSYILPDETIGGPDGERIYLQADAGSSHLLKQSGTLQEWQDSIARYAIGNPRLAFCISAAFASVLIEPLGTESGGFHFYGYSSKGKSTVQYAAGSVCGGGGHKGFLRRWRSTSNGLESVAVFHNDNLLVLDEIAECDPRELGAIVYMLGNGQGKIRSSKAGGVRKTLEWLNMIISSGEKTIEDHMLMAGHKTYAGQEVRLVNLPAESPSGYGVFDELHVFSSGEAFSKHLVESSRRYYGTALREFLKKIIGQNLLDKIKLEWRKYKENFIKSQSSEGMATEVLRVLERFAIVAFAGNLAARLQVLPWPDDESEFAAVRLFKDWIAARGTVGSTATIEAIRRVRAFIGNNPDRFQRIQISDAGAGEQAPERWQDDRNVTRNRVGFVKPDDDGVVRAYHFLPDAFKTNVCEGMDPRQVIAALRTAEFLIASAGRDQYAIRIPEHSSPVRVYSISSKILE